MSTDTFTIDDLNRDQLYDIAQDFNITGRADMNKSGLLEAARDELGDDPFSDLDEVEEGDVVQMNHLSTPLHITALAREDDIVVVVMETKRGGRHKLVARKAAPVGKNGADPHLERWRAGDEEWMNNSDDPTYFRVISTADDAENEEPEDVAEA